MKAENLVGRAGDWGAIRAAFRWPAPTRYNIAEQICDRWARAAPERIALELFDGQALRRVSYGRMAKDSARLANVLSAHGLRRGDRCALLLPQSYETALTHIACYRMGAVVVPLFTLFGADGLRYRLSDSGARMIVSDSDNLAKIESIRADLPDLAHCFSIDGGAGKDIWALMARASDQRRCVDTGPDDPAFISYTSGTTGPPKGALHGHRVLLGHLPGVETHHNFLPQAGDRLWTPADWAWMGGLTNVMMPALNYGVPLLVHRMAKFDPERAFDLMRRQQVRNAFLPPTALKLMRQVRAEPLNMRSVGSGGESLGAGMLDWGKAQFGTGINEFYGQTECNLVLGNCGAVFAPRPGSTGKAVPGAEVAIIDAQGNEVAHGEHGEIAVRKGLPQMFLRYWNAPEKTAAKFVGDWLRTGDVGHRDADGFFFFEARDDDVITSSGYRIGPSEIEDCLTGHANVTMAAVIGVPDAVRTEVLKAFVVLDGVAASADLEQALIARVRERISPHVAPRSIAFVDYLPMTATGKVMRRELRKKETDSA